MRHILRFSLILVYLFSALSLFSQEKCKVLKPELNGTYEGKCKNGLANGKGTAVGTDRYEGQFSRGLPDGEGKYTWSTGETYSGEWVAGLRQGIGTYTMHTPTKDSVQSGLWQADKYMGPKPKEPSVLYVSGVDRYSFKKNITAKNRVLVDIYQNGARNRGVTNYIQSASSGHDTQLGGSVGYDEVVFPVTLKIMYTTLNKAHSTLVNVTFEFIIYEPGDWTVEVNN
jgi:hypothetical protein